MEPFVTMGLVLKETQYREADRILTILTPKLGVISALAKNSMRVTNKLFSGCGLFCYSEFTLVKAAACMWCRRQTLRTSFMMSPKVWKA